MVREMQEYLRPSVGVNWGVTRKPGMGVHTVVTHYWPVLVQVHICGGNGDGKVCCDYSEK